MGTQRRQQNKDKQKTCAKTAKCTRRTRKTHKQNHATSAAKHNNADALHILAARVVTVKRSTWRLCCSRSPFRRVANSFSMAVSLSANSHATLDLLIGNRATKNRGCLRCPPCLWSAIRGREYRRPAAPESDDVPCHENWNPEHRPARGWWCCPFWAMVLLRVLQFVLSAPSLRLALPCFVSTL